MTLGPGEGYKLGMRTSDKPEHHCGVVGLFSTEDINIPERLFYPLYALQHRGQESAGIAYTKPNGLVSYKDLGLVGKVLSHYLREEHPSRAGIGHVRYSTHGGNRLENVQPLHVTSNRGEMALAHNGNISNIDQLQAKLTDEGAIYQSTTDTEVVLHLLSRSRKADFLEALKDVLGQLEGSFSMALLHQGRLLALRDSRGFRPLYVGRKGTLTAVASETVALEMLNIDEYREVEPGEILIIDDQGWTSHRFSPPRKQAHCVFEFIYFARPDSQIFGKSVYRARKAFGRALAQVDPVKGDLVMAVPDSGNAAALGYAEEKGIPFELGLTRNHFTGRSFTLPSQDQREFAVKMKLHPIRDVISGKSLILVDDSLVRGTTSRFIVKMLREAGAREIHLRLSSPEIKYPCFYGIDIPTRGELISNTHDPEALAKHVGADSVLFLPIPKVREALGDQDDHCFACFSGDYPEPLNALQRQSTLLKRDPAP